MHRTNGTRRASRESRNRRGRLAHTALPADVLRDGVTWEDSPVTRREFREMQARLAAVERVLDVERVHRAEESAREVYGCALDELPGLRTRRSEVARDLAPMLGGLRLPKSQGKSLARRIAACFVGLR